jgi:peptide/nickel transport system substrate-binding protein
MRLLTLEVHQKLGGRSYYSTPYYLANIMGLRALWPLPRHRLENEYETNDAVAFTNLPYWTDEYIHLGPFRLVSFDSSDSFTLQAYDGYFLGRSRLDTIHLKIFTDANALYANLLAGTVDMFHENTLAPNQAFDLMNRWHPSGEGTIYVQPGVPRFLAPQWRLTHQAEPTVVTDIRVRAALYHAIDREAVSEAMQAGQAHLAAFEILPRNEPLHEATRDGLRRYVYDPQRAQAILAEVGWVPGADRLMRHIVEGRTFRAPITATAGRDRDAEIAIIADFWRRIGLAPEESILSPAQTRDAEARASYAGFELSSTSDGDGIVGRMTGTAASAATRWVGNRDGYENPHADQLVIRYQSSLMINEQFQAMRSISDLVANELPFLLLYTTAYHFGVNSRVNALNDHAGGAGASNNYGSFSRNGHLWELR